MMAWKDHTRWLLPASLLLNAFVIGAMAGQLGHPLPGLPHHGPPPPRPADTARHIAQGLAPGDAALVAKAFDSQAAAFDAAERLRHEADGRFRAAVEAPAFDAEALKRALDAIRAAHDAEDAALAAAFLDAAAGLSPEARRHLAARVPPPDGPPPPPDRPPPPPDPLAR
jgi:uncharacterized membrane protein